MDNKQNNTKENNNTLWVYQGPSKRPEPEKRNALSSTNFEDFCTSYTKSNLLKSQEKEIIFRPLSLYA